MEKINGIYYNELYTNKDDLLSILFNNMYNLIIINRFNKWFIEGSTNNLFLQLELTNIDLLFNLLNPLQIKYDNILFESKTNHKDIDIEKRSLLFKLIYSIIDLNVKYRVYSIDDPSDFELSMTGLQYKELNYLSEICPLYN